MRNRPNILSGNDYSNLTKYPQTDSSLQQWAAILAKVPLVRVSTDYQTSGINRISFTKTLQGLQEPIYHPSIGHVHAKTVKSFLKGYATTNFSDFGPKKSSMFNQAVPILMYAHKVFNNVPYEEWWCSEDEHLHLVFNNYCKWIPTYRATMRFAIPDSSELSERYVDEIRQKAVTDKYGVVHPFTSYKCNKIESEAFDSLESAARRMLLQLWIWNADKRTDFMILNWENWDEKPEPFDSVVTETQDIFS